MTQSSSFTIDQTLCLTLLTPYIKSSQQPNGQNQLVILGITDSSSFDAQLYMTVTQQIVTGLRIEYYVLIGISAFVFILITITIIYIIIKRRRRNQART